MSPGDRVVIVAGPETGKRGYLVVWDSKTNQARIRLANNQNITLTARCEDLRRA